MLEPLQPINYEIVDISDPASLLAHAKKLEGHTFRDVLELSPSNAKRYDRASYKGGMGNLIEECYFGYSANGNPAPDFEEAGIELKLTCYDTKAGGDIRAGERLVLGMIAYDETIEADVYDSHMWEKGSDILLIYYGRDKTINKFDQQITHALLFTPPEEDRAVIEEDYATIQKYVMEGRADELSESITRYLGACTKGANAEKSMRDQKVYAPGKLARGRAWCYKNSYMDSVLHYYILGDEGGESIIKDPAKLRGRTFEEYVLSLLEPYIGMRDVDIARKIELDSNPGNKSFWKMIAFRLLGLNGSRALEFEKANIKVRTVRIEEDGKIKESFPLPPFRFESLAAEESWEESELFAHFDETRYFFTVFEKDEDSYKLKGAKFWSMPKEDMDGPLKNCWQETRDKVRDGVTFTKTVQKSGKEIIHNDLPGMNDNPVAHVRPHTSLSAYKLKDGTERGNILRHGDRLPDGQWMTRQSFWLNNDYIKSVAQDSFGG